MSHGGSVPHFGTKTFGTGKHKVTGTGSKNFASGSLKVTISGATPVSTA